MTFAKNFAPITTEKDYMTCTFQDMTEKQKEMLGKNAALVPAVQDLAKAKTNATKENKAIKDKFKDACARPTPPSPPTTSPSKRARLDQVNF